MPETLDCYYHFRVKYQARCINFTRDLAHFSKLSQFCISWVETIVTAFFIITEDESTKLMS